MQNYRTLLKELPKEALNPRPLRLFYLGIQSVIGLTATWAIVTQPLDWPVKLVLALVIGHCWGMNGLAGHEILHGSVVRNRKLQDVLGFFSFLPFLISPTFWRYWHNTQHHSHTQKLLQDPDAYPTHRIFKHSKFMQWMFSYTPGSGTIRSYFYFFFWFSFNSLMGQFYFRFRNNMFERLNHKRVNYELAAGILLTLGFLVVTGVSSWLFVAVIPFAVQNYLVFSYISTNHNLSPLTKENDPLINSLTVTNHPLLEFLHLNFGYHVEHHLFPSMSPAHAKDVHRLLKKHYPETYQAMPKFKAMRELYRTARIYKNHTELIHPYTNELFPTLGMIEEAGAVNVLPTENISLVVETIDAEPNALA